MTTSIRSMMRSEALLSFQGRLAYQCHGGQPVFRVRQSTGIVFRHLILEMSGVCDLRETGYDSFVIPEKDEFPGKVFFLLIVKIKKFGIEGTSLGFDGRMTQEFRPGLPCMKSLLC